MSELQAPLTPDQVDAADDHLMSIVVEEEPEPITDEELDDLARFPDQGISQDAAQQLLKEVIERRKWERDYYEALERHAERLGIETGFDEDVPKLIKKVISQYGLAWRNLEDVERELKAGEERANHYFSMGYGERTRMLLNHLERKADNHLRRYKHLLEDMQVWARAITIIAGTVMDAGTHREKDARMRGLIGACESAVAELRKNRDDQYNYYTVPDVFRSDYPVREYVQQIHQLEAEIKRLTGNGEGEKRADDIPF